MTRQEAIGVIKEFVAYGEHVNAFVYKGSTSIPIEALNMAIKALHHEQERREDIYKCPNCTGEVHKNYIYCPFCGIKVDEGITMTTHGAIKILRNTAWLGTNEDREKTEQAIEVVAEALEQEPKRGSWLHYLETGLQWMWECSECRSRFTTPWDYCPHCGADMRGDEE